MKERMSSVLTSLTAKYVAVFTLLVAVPAIGISWYLLDASYNDNKAALVREQQDRAGALAGKFEDSLKKTVEGLRTVHLEGLSPTDIENVLEGVGNIELFGQPFYLNCEAEAISTDLVAVGDFGGQRTFDTARRFGQFFSDVKPDQRMYVIARENSGCGAVGTLLDTAGSFEEVIGAAPLEASAYAYVLTDKGGLVAHTNFDVRHRVELGELTSRDFLGLHQIRAAHASTDPEGSATGRSLDGVKIFSAWAKIGSTGMRVFVEQPESAAFAPLRGKIWRTALLIAAFVALAVGLSILLARRLVRPIKRMHVAAEAIGAGAYDERIELDRRDELGALATAFNVMAERVQDLIGGLERKVAERTQALEVASQHKSDFLANMSHELRTPLNAIVGFSQVLKQKLFGPVNDKQDEYLDDILSSADHLLALINDILDLSKVEAGQVELEVAPFSLREALERGVVMVRERATKNGVQLDLELDPQVDVVEGDERRIRQVVFNLLSNAVKFTPRGGRVDVSAAQENGEVLVCVKDTGSGISVDDQERIFEEFQQARDTNGERPEGTGLGLALSRSLVELHGGRIWVESEVGKGSTFTFTIPVGSAS